MTRLDALRRAWAIEAEVNADHFERAVANGNAHAARAANARYQRACATLRELRLLRELGEVGR